MPLPLTLQTNDRAIPDGVRRLAATPNTLHDLIQLGCSVSDVVIQDEFTHDVVVSFGEVFAVYDST